MSDISNQQASSPGGVQAAVAGPPEEHDRTASPLDMLFIWGGVNIAVTNLAVGALGIALGLSLSDTMLVYFVGGAIGALSLALGVLQGKRTGVPVMQNARSAFGVGGSRMLGGLLFLMSAGWFGVNSYFGVTAARSITEHFGIGGGHTRDLVLLVLIVVGQLAIALYGFELIRRYERVALLAVASCLVLVAAFAMNGHISWGHRGELAGSARVGTIIVLITALGVGWALSWTPWAQDFGRHVRTDASDRATFWWAFVGMWVFSFLTFSLSAAIATTTGATFDVGRDVSGVLPAGLAVPVLLVMSLGLISANVVPLYSGGFALISAGLKWPRRRGTLLTALFGIAIPTVGLFQDSFTHTFHNWMLALLIWIAPWFTILMIDFFVIHRGRYTAEQVAPAPLRGWSDSWPGVVSWLVAFVSSWAFANTPVYASPIVTERLAGADLSIYVGAVVAAAIYYPWMTSRMRRARASAQA